MRFWVSSMNVLVPLLIFITGLIFGSFFNVVIYRLPEGKSIIAPRSFCPSCGAKLKAYDLIPVFSFIFLRGKCRYCGCKISFRYPLVELVTGVVFVILYIKFGLSVEFIFTVFLMSILLMVFFIDLEHMIIPNELVIAGLIGGIALFVLRFWFDDALVGDSQWYSPILGMLATSGFLLLVALIGLAIYGTDAFGMGDVKIFLYRVNSWPETLSDITGILNIYRRYYGSFSDNNGTQAPEKSYPFRALHCDGDISVHSFRQ